MTKEERKYKNYYSHIHKWICKNWGKANYCFFDKNHKTTKFEWANLSGLYLKNRDDWIQVCPSCHRKLDFTEHQRKLLRKANLGNKNAVRSVKQFSKNGEFVNSFDSLKEASESTGIIRTAISNVLIGRSNSAGGFIWL